MYVLRNTAGQYLNRGNVWGYYSNHATLLFTFAIDARCYADKHNLTDIQTHYV